MLPITILVNLIGFVLGSVTGYAFGSAAREQRFLALQEQISKQAKVIAEYESRIADLCRRLEAIRASRGVLQRFVWFVFKSDPKLYRAFAELERTEGERAQARERFETTVTTLQEEFPDHPTVRGLGVSEGK